VAGHRGCGLPRQTGPRPVAGRAPPGHAPHRRPGRLGPALLQRSWGL